MYQYSVYGVYAPRLVHSVYHAKITPASSYHPLHARRRTIRVPFGTQRFLAALEGVEGGFAVGSSIVVALSLAGLSHDLLLVTAMISIIVSGFNSSSVKYSSEHYLDELDGREKKSPIKHYLIPSLIEFICYVVLSIISILPLLLMTDTSAAVSLSAIITILLLFTAGAWRGYMVQMHPLKDGLELALLGTGIILVGLVSGAFVNSL